MSELERKFLATARNLERVWDDEALDQVAAGARARAKRRSRTRRLGLGAAAAVVVAVIAGVALRTPVVPAATEASVYIDLGVPSDPRFNVLEASPDALVLELVEPKATFRVQRQEGRTVRVKAGPAIVEVIGTTFTVELVGQDTVVAVDEGRVKVSVAGVSKVLTPGERQRFSPPPVATPEPPASEPVPDEPQAPPVGVAAPASPPAPARPQENWRALARRGEFARAYPVLSAVGPSDEPTELLLAADVARLSGHPRAAVPWLRRVAMHFTRDARAALAAFTLGRVLLDDLGDPRGAARAFAQVRVLEPKGPLAADALAREAEALHRLGETAAARERALEYLERYPDGRKAAAVRGWGGL
ncbi:MAG: FecR domain-containing protein [Myxococcaceae bacterium]|jgi:transmembrane sensor|nr:FecR domain-containing protein [Myxococcaceae bacterium]